MHDDAVDIAGRTKLNMFGAYQAFDFAINDDVVGDYFAFYIAVGADGEGGAADVAVQHAVEIDIAVADDIAKHIDITGNNRRCRFLLVAFTAGSRWRA